MFTGTTAIVKLLALEKRRKIIQGGTWAGKTFGIMAVIIDYLTRDEGKSFTVVAESIPAIKKGALNDFKTIMYTTGRWQEKSYNATDRMYRFANGNTIEFNSFDSVGKAQAAGKRTDLFINEAYHINFDIADTLMTRTSGNIWIDYNPTSEFWAHTEILPKADSELIILKYSDNEQVPETIKQDLEEKREKAKTSAYWANWCRIYIDGEIGSLQGVIFDNWSQVDGIPATAKLQGFGLDFGFTNDPTTLVALYTNDQKRYYRELLYQKGLSNGEIAKLCKSLNPTNEIIYADSSEPKSIAEIRNYGVNISAVKKGPDSIKFGISIMQEEPFYITSDSNNYIRELRNYKWDKDNTGKDLNVPVDAFNHCIDGARYVSMMKLKAQKAPLLMWKTE